MCAVSVGLVVACIMFRWCACSPGDVTCSRVCLGAAALELENSESSPHDGMSNVMSLTCHDMDAGDVCGCGHDTYASINERCVPDMCLCFSCVCACNIVILHQQVPKSQDTIDTDHPVCSSWSPPLKVYPCVSEYCRLDRTRRRRDLIDRCVY